MRDRTASRNYSAEREEFRREHERHREWGLRRRHAEKLQRIRQRDSGPPSKPATAGVQGPRAADSPRRPAPPIPAAVLPGPRRAVTRPATPPTGRFGARRATPAPRPGPLTSLQLTSPLELGGSSQAAVPQAVARQSGVAVVGAEADVVLYLDGLSQAVVPQVVVRQSAVAVAVVGAEADVVFDLDGLSQAMVPQSALTKVALPQSVEPQLPEPESELTSSLGLGGSSQAALPQAVVPQLTLDLDLDLGQPSQSVEPQSAVSGSALPLPEPQLTSCLDSGPWSQSVLLRHVGLQLASVSARSVFFRSGEQLLAFAPRWAATSQSVLPRSAWAIVLALASLAGRRRCALRCPALLRPPVVARLMSWLRGSGAEP
jgi:hypothetical protein